MSTAIQEHLHDAATNEVDDIAVEQSELEEFQKPYDQSDLCDSNPEFAVICSFIARFGSLIDLQLDIERLKDSIESQESLNENLIELHVKLLKKTRRYLVRDQWERALVRFTYEYSNEDGYELESLGYLKTRPSIKLSILRRLLDAQFECDSKFKALVNAFGSEELRNQPTGRDIKGNTYWHCADDEGNIRVYRDEPLDHTGWRTICQRPEDLRGLLDELESSKGDKIKGEPRYEPYNPYPEIFSELFVKEQVDIVQPKATRSTLSRKPANKDRGHHHIKSSPLHTLKEIDENTISNDLQSKSEPTVNGNSLSKDNRPRSISPCGTSSVESQVKHTIENILNKVASSFDFVFRRSSPDTLKQLPPYNDIEVKKETKPKKKREKRHVEELPRRTSSRIQQIQQKKVLEQEEISKRRKIEAEIKLVQVEDTASRDSVVSERKTKSRRKKDKQRWRGTKGKKKLSWDKDDSDLSSTSSLTDSSDGSFIQAIDQENDFTNDVDEFACEEEETNDAPVIIKRARTARQSMGFHDISDANNTTLIEEDKPCGRCDKSNDPETILLCDMCDDGYHTACCLPPLMYVPDGDWFCPLCEHGVLIKKLTDILNSVEAILTIKELERVKRQRLRQTKKDKEKEQGPAKPQAPEVISGRKRDNFVNELSDPIAVQELDEEVAGSSDECLLPTYKERSYGHARKKKKKTKLKRSKKRARRWTDSDDDDLNFAAGSISDSASGSRDYTGSSEALEESEDSDKPKVRKARACVSYKFQEYDDLIQSAICADSEQIDAGLTDHENEVEDEDEEEGEASTTCNVGRGKDMAIIEALAYQQENGLEEADAPVVGETVDLEPPKKPAGQRKKGRKLNDLDADSEIDVATSDESFQASSATEEDEDEDDEEDEEETEVTTEESSIDEIVDMRRTSAKSKRTRRAAVKQVSYRESTDEEDEIAPRSLTPQPHPPFYEDDDMDC